MRCVLTRKVSAWFDRARPASDVRDRRRLPGARSLLVAAVLVVAIAVATPSSTLADGDDGAATPEPYSEYLVLIANGVFDPDEPHPNVPGCEDRLILCDGDYFQEETMEWSSEEIAEKRAEAKAWFKQRFGIDVDDPANDDRVEFFSFTADPRWDYRVYTWSGRDVPSEGYDVRDGGWAVRITNPGGYTLGGELDGVKVEQGDMAVFGNYNILISNEDEDEEVVLHYRANSFMEINELGNMYIDCQMARDGFADGQEGAAQGLGNVTLTDEGDVDTTMKNVITFEK